jgi:hypothetical protein
LTGAGVRAAFLDEVFKASSTILNTLLTLTLERLHFNWGGMVKSDLVMLVGASNELPGGFASGTFGLGASGEDFATLYAFLDRFPLRLPIPLVSGTSPGRLSTDSDLARATKVALAREARRFSCGEHFDFSSDGAFTSVNDLLLLGRCMLEQDHWPDQADVGLFDRRRLDRFKDAFLQTASALQCGATQTEISRVSWTISPRKLKALYKIALAHAVVVDDNFAGSAQVVSGPSAHDLHVFDYIWDSPVAQNDLAQQTRACIETYMT